MEFGILKSKIEKKLSEAYSNNTFNKEIKTFKNVVLDNPSISMVYHIYEEISKPKGFEKKFAEDYLNECIDIFSRTKISKKSISMIESWIKDVVSENNYKDIDIVLNKKTLVIENILESKNRLISNLTIKNVNKEIINAPIEKLVEVANNNLKNYLSELNESELKQVNKYLSLEQNELNTRYEILSEIVIDKLEKMVNNSDSEIKEKITETINKIKNDSINVISLVKLKTLSENL